MFTFIWYVNKLIFHCLIQPLLYKVLCFRETNAERRIREVEEYSRAKRKLEEMHSGLSAAMNKADACIKLSTSPPCSPVTSHSAAVTTIPPPPGIF